MLIYVNLTAAAEQSAHMPANLRNLWIQLN